MDIVPARVRVRPSPWTRPPTVNHHVSDETRGMGKRQREGLATSVDHMGNVVVGWEPPHSQPDAPAMSNAWPADRLELL